LYAAALRPTSPPDLQLAGFELWLFGLAYPSDPYLWARGYLRATAHCAGGGAEVWVTGSFLHTTHLAVWLEATERMYRAVAGTAQLATEDPYLRIEFQMERTGQLIIRVEITPDYDKQAHRFTFDLDQSYLPPFLERLRDLLHQFAPSESADRP
jgi:hypothetical protein